MIHPAPHRHRRAVHGLAALVAVALVFGVAGADARERQDRAARKAAKAAKAAAPAASQPAAEARTVVLGPPSVEVEAQLQGVHEAMRQGRLREARAQAEALVRQAPNFQVGHLLLGDILSAQAGRFGPTAVLPVPALRMSGTLGDTLPSLRMEARHRLLALQHRPPEGHLPTAFMALPESVRHAIAVDTSRHRLYLFERTPAGLRLVSDHYISVGKSGIEKRQEGDQRTPLGVYFTTSRLEGRQLGELYGSGALTLNYPNEVDRLKGRTGSGIWLHGTPSAQYARAPLSTDGCVVLSNSDMQQIMQTVAPHGTPVVIADRLDWIEPHHAERASRGLGEALRHWWQARDAGDTERLAGFYASSAQPMAEAPSEMRRVSTRDAGGPWRFQAPKDLSILTWRDQFDHAVVTFGDVGRKARTGVVRRQYWAHDGQRWRIVHESVNGSS